MAGVKRPSETSPSGMVDGPVSRHQWLEFLRAEEDTLRQTYKIDGKRLVADANAERESRGDYRGREILELLQNADDAATEVEIPGRVLFEFSEHGLLVGNTGRPFSEGGLESILLAHVSPKRKEGGILIGAKGLGFRSLLNWTEAPFLSSGALEVGFSRMHATQQVDLLCRDLPDLRKRMAKNKVRAPILRFPYWTDLEGSAGRLLARARERRSEFDTVVGVPFRDDGVRQEIETQLRDLSPRLLLFLQSTKEIEVHGIDGEAQLFRLEEQGGVVRVSSTGDESPGEEWVLRTVTEELPPSYVNDDDIRQVLQVSVAIRVDDDCDCEFLSSFFPTRHRMPVPGLFHGTFDLEQNRQQLRDSEANRYVLARLAALHASFIEDLTDNGQIEPLKFMVAREQPRDILGVFLDRFYEEVRSRCVVPTRGRGFVRPDQARAFPEPGHDFSDKRWFQQYVPTHDADERAVLECLDVTVSSEAEIVGYLERRKLEIPQLAELVLQLLWQDFSCPQLRRLIIGQGGGAGTGTTRWFPPPTKDDKRLAKFPTGLEFRFINRNLWDEICDRSEENEKDTITSLSDFGVESYDPVSIVSAFAERLDQLAKDPRAKIEQRREEFLDLLVAIFKGPRAGVPSLSPIDVPWPALDGTWRLVRELHTVEPGSESGPVNASLFSTRPDLLACPVDELGLDIDSKTASDFLHWIGVHDWPRIIERDLTASDRELIKAVYSERITYRENSGANKQVLVAEQELNTYRTGLSGETQWIDGLGDILEHAPDTAILKWLGSGDAVRLENLTTSLRFKPSSNANRRAVLEKPSRSLALQHIAQESWLRDDQGVPCAPGELMLPVKRAPALPKPFLSVLPHGPMPFGLDNDALAIAFQRSGVSPDIEHASPPAVFKVLSRLAAVKPNADLAMPVYRKLALRSDLSTSPESEASYEFEEGGLLLARGPKGPYWYRPGDIVHVTQSDTMRKVVSSIRPVFDVSEVRQGFLEAVGVRAFDPGAVSITDIDTRGERHDLTGELAHCFEDVKSWIRVWANHEECDPKKMEVVSRARVIVAESPLLQLDVDGELASATLPAWAGVVWSDFIVLSVEPGSTLPLFQDVGLPEFARTVAEHLDLKGQDYFVEMVRARSPVARLRQLQLKFPELDPDTIEALLGRMYPDDDPASAHNFVLPPLSRDATRVIEELPSDGQAQAETGDQPAPGSKEEATDGTEANTMVDWVQAQPETRAESEPIDYQRGGRPAKRVRSGSSSTGQQEELDAFRFEEAQGRFPCSVGEERGRFSEGCDLVSFTTDEARNRYLETRDSKLVARFIEVKGGEMQLSSNQVSAARQHTDRYFVYHVYRSQGGGQVIETFRDPVRWSEPADWVLVVDNAHALDSHREKFVSGQDDGTAAS